MTTTLDATCVLMEMQATLYLHSVEHWGMFLSVLECVN